MYEREGEQLRDKTVALAEDRPSGYGIRTEKHQGKPVKVKHQTQIPEKGKPRPQQIDSGIPQMKPM